MKPETGDKEAKEDNKKEEPEKGKEEDKKEEPEKEEKEEDMVVLVQRPVIVVLPTRVPALQLLQADMETGPDVIMETEEFL